jgi:hypothetical protein
MARKANIPAHLFRPSPLTRAVDALRTVGTEVKGTQRQEKRHLREKDQRRCRHGLLEKQCTTCHPSSLFENAPRLKPVVRPERDLKPWELEIARAEVRIVGERQRARTEAKRKRAQAMRGSKGRRWGW